MTKSAKTWPWIKTVAQVVRAIPKGKSMSYAQVALRANKPGGARAVVQALHHLTDVPWWRVVKSDGTVAVQMIGKQGKRLRAEGVALVGRRIPRSARFR